MMNQSQQGTLGSRLLAIVYDVLIVLFIIIVSIIVIQLLLGQGKEIPANHIIHKILKGLWFLLSFLYFGYYWTKRGQTPGMRVWKIKVINKEGSLISWPQALLRYVFALLGVGLLWIIFDKNNLALQDRLSQTSLIKS